MSEVKPRRRRCLSIIPLPSLLAALALTASLGCGGAPAAPERPAAPKTYEEPMALVAEGEKHLEAA